jgi:hypothetical protein
MGRQIILAEDADRRAGTNVGAERGTRATSSRLAADTYADRVLKYIPAEIVALYLAVSHMVKSAATEQNQHLTLWSIIIAALLVATPVYLRRVERVSSYSQIAISTFALAIWVFALDNPFDYVVSDHASLSLYKAVILPIFTFFVGLLVPQGNSLKLANATSRTAARNRNSI